MRNCNTFFLLLLLSELCLSGCRTENVYLTDKINNKITGWSLDSIRFSYNWISPADVDFINPKTGYILGSNGYLLKTTDSTKTWRNSNIDSTGVMTSSMSFINEFTGYIYGTWNILNGSFYGTLYKTMDGGLHWTKQHYDKAYNLHSLKFFDENHGIALDRSNAGMFIITTSNGGLSWEVGNIELDQSAFRLFFLGQICYVSGKNQKILKSTDLGKTWKIINTPASTTGFINGYYFFNEDIGFLNLFDKKYKTTDGGNSWIELKKPFPDFATPSAPFENFHFCNANEGIAIHDSLAFVGGDFQTFIGSYVYTTKDGGNSWVKSDLFQKFWFGETVYISSDFAYCISNKNIYKLRKN